MAGIWYQLVTCRYVYGTYYRMVSKVTKSISKVRVVSPISRISSFLTMLLSDVSSVLLHANSVNSMLHPHRLSRNMLTSCLHSLSSCSTLRWPVVYFQLTSQTCASVIIIIIILLLLLLLCKISVKSSETPPYHNVVTESVTPSLKKMTLDPFDLGNYRPISNLTFVSKLLEHAAHEQIVGYASENQLLSDTQSAYQKHRSTETAILKNVIWCLRGCRLGQVNVARSARPQRRVWYGWSSDSTQSVAAFVRYFWNRAWLDSVLPHWTHSVRTIQWSVIQDGTCDFRRSSRFGSWADPFPHLHCRSRTRGPKAWFQRSCIRGRPADLRSHGSIGHGRPAATNGRLYRGCLHLDVLESTMPQSLEDWTHLVGIISTASELCHGHRNERSGISHSSGRLGQRSRCAHRQRPYLVWSCQQSRRVVLLPYSTTSHRATNIDGWGCTLPGTSFHPQPDWLLQRYFGIQSEIPHWEATVRASCRRQTRPTIAQSLARFHFDARSTSLAVRRIKSEV